MAKKQMFRRISRAELVFKRIQAAEKRDIYAQLLWIAANKNRKAGWVAHKFKAVFGKWPKPSGKVEPMAPCSDLLTWLERERRNYGQRMKRQEEAKRELTAKQSAAVLDRLEAILAELEANPLVLEPACQEDTDCEALDIAHSIELRMRASMEQCSGLPSRTNPSPDNDDRDNPPV